MALISAMTKTLDPVNFINPLWALSTLLRRLLARIRQRNLESSLQLCSTLILPLRFTTTCLLRLWAEWTGQFKKIIILKHLEGWKIPFLRAQIQRKYIHIRQNRTPSLNLSIYAIRFLINIKNVQKLAKSTLRSLKVLKLYFFKV